MKIIRLELRGFRRLDLIGTDSVIYTPESPYQLILGISGVGKSSLLNELSPLPCDSNDLREGGYKEIELEHRNSHYVLRYELNKKLDCFFIKEGKHLNDGNTIKIQRSLIAEHFNYDNEIHDVLIGHTLLSNMPSAQRREWFTRMSNSDMTYAIALFNKLRGAERDLRGAIKLNNQRLANEQVKLPSKEDIIRIKNENKTLKEELNHLLPYTNQSLADVSQEIILLGEQLQNIAANIVDIKFITQVEGVADTEEIKYMLNELEYRKRELEEDYAKQAKRFAEEEESAEKINKILSTSIEDYRDRLGKIEYELQSKTEALKSLGFTLDQHYQHELSALTLCLSALKLLYSEMLPNPLMSDGERRFTRQKQEVLKNKIVQYQTTLIALNNKKEYNERLITNMENVHSINCPSCNHSFKPGVDCSQLTALKEVSTKLTREIAQTQSLLDEALEEQQQFNEWFTPLLKLNQLFNVQYPELKSFSYELRKLDCYFDNPIGLSYYTDNYFNALTLQAGCDQLKEDYANLKEELNHRISVENVAESDINKLEYRHTAMKKIELAKEALNKLYDKISHVKHVITDREKLTTYRVQLREQMKRRNDLILSQIKYENNVKLQEIISEKQSALAINEQFASSLNQTETVISQLEKMTEQYKNEQHALRILTTLLSPQDGLIAESLIGFINQFLNEMENVLDQIWTYDIRPYLELSDEGIDLDYKFKVDIEGLERPVSDVSRLSTGQKEVVDFVFKLLLMQYLDMQDYPLFMDEIGGRFDALHRDRLYRYLKLLVESNQIQQVFVISHIASSHDTLTQADKCILDTDAIMIDETVNRVFKLGE